MKKITLVMFFCLTMAGGAHAGCDTAQSVKVQSMIHDLAVWTDYDNKVEVQWGSDWEQYTPTQKKGMITVFADSDSCLTGKARAIEFYRNGKLVGEASPTFGIRLR